MSEQFLNGFTCGVAYHVLGSQFPHMFGIEVENQNGVFTLTKEIIEVISNVSKTNIVALIVSLTCIVTLLAFKIYVNEWIKEKFKIKV
jgi:MFS superfamily sulfate permease-like transporter